MEDNIQDNAAKENIRGKMLYRILNQNQTPTDEQKQLIEEEYEEILAEYKNQCDISNSIYNLCQKLPKIDVKMACKPINPLPDGQNEDSADEEDYNEPGYYENSSEPEYNIDNYKFKTNLVPGKTYVIVVNTIGNRKYPNISKFYKQFDKKITGNNIYKLQQLNRALVHYTEFLQKYSVGGNMVVLADFVEPYKCDCNSLAGFKSDDKKHLVFNNVRPYPDTTGITSFVIGNEIDDENCQYDNLYIVEPYSGLDATKNYQIGYIKMEAALDNPNIQNTALRYDVGYKSFDPNNLGLFDLRKIHIYDDINSLEAKDGRKLPILLGTKGKATKDIINTIQGFLGPEQISQVTKAEDFKVPYRISNESMNMDVDNNTNSTRKRKRTTTDETINKIQNNNEIGGSTRRKRTKRKRKQTRRKMKKYTNKRK